MKKSVITLGKTNAGEPVEIPVNILNRHVVVLGASGSGKTVFSKCIVEEAVRNNIPAIIIDPQGDFASLGIINDKEETLSHGTDTLVIDEYAEKAEVRIFTPASSRGLALSIDPLKLPARDLPLEEAIQAIDVTSIDLTGLMGFNVNSAEGEDIKNFIYLLLESAWKTRYDIKDLNMLTALVKDPTPLNIDAAQLSERLQDKLVRKIQYLSMGTSQLLFNFGTQFTIETMVTPVKKGRVPINIIYLNTLSSDIYKQFFVSSIGKEIYTWMLKNPSDDVQLLFCIDEVAPYLPPHPNNPPAKTILKMLFKQARKYGVSCLMCTQNPADIDYKAMAQANTWALGRLMARQDIAKVRHMLKGKDSVSADILSTLKSGEFVLICPDVYDIPVHMQVRWLVTKHETLDEDRLSDVMSGNIREKFGVPASPVISFADETIEKKKSAAAEEQDLMFKLNYPQNRAIKRVHLEGNIFKRTEKVVNGKLKLVPLWQVICKEVRRKGLPLISRKVKVKDILYFNALDGQLLSLDAGQVRFLKVLPKEKDRIKDLNLDSIHLVESTSKNTAGTIIQPKITAARASDLAKALFGVEVVDTRLVKMPVWTFIIENKTGKKRRLLLDAMLGKEVLGLELK